MIRIAGLVTFGTALFAAAPGLLAQTADPDALAKCAAIDDNMLRLHCYDRLTPTRTPPIVRPEEPPAPSAPPPPAPATTPVPPPPPTVTPPPVRPAPGQQRVGNWTVLEERTASGGRDIFLRSDSLNEIKDSLGLPVSRPALMINCENRRLSLYVRWPYAVSQKIQRAEYRIDGAKPRILAMAYSRDLYSTGLWSALNSARFIRGLVGKQRIVFSLKSADGYPMAATFPLGGLAEALSRLEPECKV